MKKKRISTIAICMMLFLTLALTPVFGASAITLSLDDEELASDAAPIIQDGRTLVPIRVITENLNCDVKWDKDTKTVTITEENANVLKLTIGSKEGIKTKVDGTESTFQMDVPASIISGRTMVPIRAITENLSSAPQIGWSNTLRKVCIYTPGYLSENGINNVDSHIAGLKATINTSNIKYLGYCFVYVDGETYPHDQRTRIIDADGVHYINGLDYVNCMYGTNDISNIYAVSGESWVGYKKLIDNPYGGSDGYYQTEYKEGEYGEITKKYSKVVTKTLIEDAVDSDGMPMEQYDEVRNDVLVNTDKNTKFLYPIISYGGEIYIPLTGGLYNGDSINYTVGKNSSNLVIASSYYLQQNEKAAQEKAEQEAQAKEAAAKEEAARQSIKVGDTVYATTVFYKCWGTVEQVNGSKVKVNWVQVTDIYGMLVDDYYNEMDALSQASMSTKGIMMGTSTWVNLSDLYKK